MDVYLASTLVIFETYSRDANPQRNMSQLLLGFEPSPEVLILRTNDC